MTHLPAPTEKMHKKISYAATFNNALDTSLGLKKQDQRRPGMFLMNKLESKFLKDGKRRHDFKIS